jgi:putative ABC transport system permease protein
MVRFALRNLLDARGRFAATVAAIGVSVFLMLFQGSLLAGFLRAAGRIIVAADADLWIMARGVPCVDFPAPLPSRLRELARGDPDVAHAFRLITGFVWWQRPDGLRRTVALVGADEAVGPGLPLPRQPGSPALLPDAVVADRGTLRALGVAVTGDVVGIGGRRASLAGIVEDFGSFLGSPYAFTGFEDARRVLRIDDGTTGFVALRLAAGADPETTRRRLQRRFADFDVRTGNEFARASGLYWMTQTGAGGAIGLAALLGFVVGAVVISQTVYATTMERIEEFATMRALGASDVHLGVVVLTQSIACGLLGTLFGLTITWPLCRLARRYVVSWVHTPPVAVMAVIGATGVMCLLAAWIPMRTALRVDPGRVFRA